jgi:bifunctional non-homologous end joining protein LigD
MFEPLKPMLAPSAAVKVDDIPKSGWWLEPKFDGIRFHVHVFGNGVRAVGGRNLKEHPCPAWLAEAMKLVPEGTVLDGELYVPGGHSADVAAIVNADDRRFVAFDLPKLSGQDIRSQPLSLRRRLLERLALVLGAGASITPVCKHRGSFEAVYNDWLDLGLEGAVAKRLDSPYKSGGRSRDWQKIKPTVTVDVRIVGYEMGRGKSNRGMVSSLQIEMPNGKVSSTAWVGTVSEAEAIMGRLAEIVCQQVMPSGAPRSPRFIRLRPDLEHATA